MSLDTQHTNEQPECPDYSFMYLVLSVITLRNMFIIIIRQCGTCGHRSINNLFSRVLVFKDNYFRICTRFNDYVSFVKAFDLVISNLGNIFLYFEK